jgi:hypothetical protein
MKLIYNILWVDNEKGIYENHKDDIFDYLENLGFEAKINFLDDYQSFIDANLNLEDYDLFILDYKLKAGQDGNEIIKVIREDNYTEIIFYSGMPNEARKQIFDDKSNGIYITSRKFDEFEEDVLGLINITIKKVQDINNLRGLIMAEVAELERIKEKIIIKASPKISKKHIEKYVLKKIKSSGTTTKNKAETLLSDIDNVLFEDLFNKTGFIDMDKKIHATGEILDKLNITSPISKSDFIEPYKKDIRDIRNKFAHIEECDGIDEDGNSCKIIGDIPFTEKNCIKIRQEIKKYKKILEDIEQKI